MVYLYVLHLNSYSRIDIVVRYRDFFPKTKSVGYINTDEFCFESMVRTDDLNEPEKFYSDSHFASLSTKCTRCEGLKDLGEFKPLGLLTYRHLTSL